MFTLFKVFHENLNKKFRIKNDWGKIATQLKCCFNAFSPFVLGMGSSRPTEILWRSMSGNL